MERREVVYYSEIGEGMSIECILDPSIDGKEYVERLNRNIEPYNRDIDEYIAKKSALNQLYGLNRSYEEITGSERLNEREPKYPAEKPKGFKNIQEACPEITIERERRRLSNIANNEIYYDFIYRRNEIVKNELKPLKEELINKWPEFKAWINSDYSNKIYNNFQLTTYKYLKQ